MLYLSIEMFPQLLQIGPVHVLSLPLFLAAAYLSAVFLFWRAAKDENLEEVLIFDLSLLLLFGLLVGGKVAELLIGWWQFGFGSTFVRLTGQLSAFNFWGAVLGGGLVGFFYCRQHHLHPWKIFDLAIVGVAFAQVLVWLGFLFSGAAYGAQTTFSWGISLPGLLGRRHPTQILGIAVFAVIYLILARLGRRIHFDGFLTASWLMLTTVGIFLLEFLRGDSVYLFSIRANQLFALIFFILGLALFYRRSKRNFWQDLAVFPQVIFLFGREKNLRRKALEGFCQTVRRGSVDFQIRLKNRLIFAKRRIEKWLPLPKKPAGR